MTSPDRSEPTYGRPDIDRDQNTIITEWVKGLTNLGGPILGVVVGGIRDALRGEYTGDNPALRQIQDGQESISNLWTRLSPLEEYASAYTNTGSGFWQGGKIRFDNLMVGSTGVELYDGGMILGDHGMWRIDSQIWVDFLIMTTTGIPDFRPRLRWELRVLRPDGSMYHRKRGAGWFANVEHSLPLGTTVVTPEAGYRVELHITDIVSGRTVLGGSDRTHLTVHHINRVRPGAGDSTGENEQ